MKRKKITLFLVLVIGSIISVYFISNRYKKIFLDNSIQDNVIIYETKNAVIYFDKNTVASFLSEKINSSDPSQYYDELFLQKIDTSKKDIKVFRISSFKATIENLSDTVDNPDIEFYKYWLNSTTFEEDHDISRYSMEWLSLDLIKKGKARVYNKKRQKDEQFIYFKEYDNGLSWGEEYYLSNDQILIKAMCGIR